MNRWTFLLFSTLIGPFLLMHPATAQVGGPGACIWCQQCDNEHIRTWDNAAGLTEIAYVPLPTCTYYLGECENLMQCSVVTMHQHERFLELIDRGDWTALVEATWDADDIVEVMASRRLLILRDGCSNAVALREIPEATVNVLLQRRTEVDD